VGGNFALLRTGDLITLNVPERTLQAQLSTEELQQRKNDWKAPIPATTRGYVSLYLNTVQQANLGADLDFLNGNSGSEVSRDSH